MSRWHCTVLAGLMAITAAPVSLRTSSSSRDFCSTLVSYVARHERAHANDIDRVFSHPHNATARRRFRHDLEDLQRSYSQLARRASGTLRKDLGIIQSAQGELIEKLRAVGFDPSKLQGNVRVITDPRVTAALDRIETYARDTCHVRVPPPGVLPAKRTIHTAPLSPPEAPPTSR